MLPRATLPNQHLLGSTGDNDVTVTTTGFCFYSYLSDRTSRPSVGGAFQTVAERDTSCQNAGLILTFFPLVGGQASIAEQAFKTAIWGI